MDCEVSAWVINTNKQSFFQNIILIALWTERSLGGPWVRVSAMMIGVLWWVILLLTTSGWVGVGGIATSTYLGDCWSIYCYIRQVNLSFPATTVRVFALWLEERDKECLPAESLVLILISEVKMTPSPPHLNCTSLLLVIIALFSMVSSDQTLIDDVDVGVFNEGKLKSKSQII